MVEATISNGKIYIQDANKLQQYVQDCINDAAERLKDHNLAKNNPLEYVIKKIVGYDQAYDPKWQPYAQFAKDNLADTKRAMNFIIEHYDDFKEAVEYMADSIGHSDFYPSIFGHGFDLVKLVVTVYTEIAHYAGVSAEILD